MRTLLISFAALGVFAAAAAADPATRATQPAAFKLDESQLDAVTAGVHDPTILPMDEFVVQMQSIRLESRSAPDITSDRHPPQHTNYRPQFYLRTTDVTKP